MRSNRPALKAFETASGHCVVLGFATSGREIGFGAITEIVLLQGKGLQFVGRLPSELQNFTTYTAAAARASASRPAGAADAAAALLARLLSPGAQAGFVAASVAAAP